MHRAECPARRAIIDRISMRLSSGSRASIQETRVPGKSRASPEGVRAASHSHGAIRAQEAQIERNERIIRDQNTDLPVLRVNLAGS